VRHRITHLSVHQCSLTLAFLYCVFGFIYIPLGYLIDSASPPDERLGLFWLAAPLVMGVIGYIGAALACALYNFIASKTGGVEFTLSAETPRSDFGV